MDTATRTINRRIATFLCLLVVVSILGGHSSDTAWEAGVKAIPTRTPK